MKSTLKESRQEQEENLALMGLLFHLRMSRKLDRHFSKSELDAFAYVEGRFRELRRSIAGESPQYRRSAALDLAALCVRYALGEYWQGTPLDAQKGTSEAFSHEI